MTTALLDSVTLSSSASSVTFSSIDQSYRSLMLVASLKNTATSGTASPVYLAVSATTGASKYTGIYATLESFTQYPQPNYTSGQNFVYFYEAPNSTSNNNYNFGTYRFEFNNYASTTSYKAGSSRISHYNGYGTTTTANMVDLSYIPSLYSNDAITQIVLTTSPGFAIYSQFNLYGIGTL